MGRGRRRPPQPADLSVILDDDIDDPVQFYEAEVAAKVALNRATQLVADVVIDLESKGALHHFLRATYKDAVKALVALVEVEPTDAAAVYALQRAIHPYFDACSFIRKVREAGAEADQTIEETYGHGEDADD